MGRHIPDSEKSEAIDLLMALDKDGNYLYGQRELERMISLSRPYIRKLAEMVGRKFLVNGVDILGQLTICVNCGQFFRRPKSKVDRANKQFCDEQCKIDYCKGSNSSNWKDGKSARSFSIWLTGQSEYKQWRQNALNRAGNKCEISGIDDEELDVHHLYPKSKFHHLSLDDSNSLVVAKSVHRRIHFYINKGYDFQKSVELVRKEFQHNEKEI